MSFDEEMRRRAGQEDCPLPENFDGWLEDQLETLPRRGRPARRWGKRLAALAAAAVALTVCTVGAAELAQRQVRYQYFETAEEADQAAREAREEGNDQISLIGRTGALQDFRSLEPWNVTEEEMPCYDEITAYARGGPGDGWGEMFTGVFTDVGTTSTYYVADTLSGLADMWPVELPDLAWLEEHYRFLESGQCLLDWRADDLELGRYIDSISISGACYSPEGAPVTLNWTFYEHYQLEDQYDAEGDGLDRVEEYTAADGAVVTIGWMTSVSGQSQFEAQYGYDRAGFRAAGAELDPDQVHALLDHLNLTSLASWQP